jgi:hypothetical protein
LKSIINHGPLKTFWVYEGIYFGHVMFKACWYVMNDEGKCKIECLTIVMVWIFFLGTLGSNAYGD